MGRVGSASISKRWQTHIRRIPTHGEAFDAPPTDPACLLCVLSLGENRHIVGLQRPSMCVHMNLGIMLLPYVLCIAPAWIKDFSDSPNISPSLGGSADRCGSGQAVAPPSCRPRPSAEPPSSCLPREPERHRQTARRMVFPPRKEPPCRSRKKRLQMREMNLTITSL